ncbi:uncharacterized protein KNAG_0E03170 [Huiozyma naganishii CBS 8797]|uniref:Glycosyltransferase family 71 protein n=1 Tax=Huiozyma naganishii (strain ATCC MYA-139 / BCRC 22969 / CBS 8797 / KCTC 17520 / NBRC 10181 / NCYC 3082 / Yp74L-3) TaxID=1071383 RepID=J7S7Y6_HUIN7|nr:hypothetical protein KNAG_0E03170 [Kazachstania naganishii CBS 8797]CCK70576.1 hypothetical protein KNAG_0E03170 [Kazachstania naganishii CBS 8797]
MWESSHLGGPNSTLFKEFEEMDQWRNKAMAYKTMNMRSLYKAVSENYTIVNHWDEFSKLDKCALMFSKLGETTPDWHTRMIYDEFESYEATNAVLELTMELLRLYDYCFLKVDDDGEAGSPPLDIIEVFKEIPEQEDGEMLPEVFNQRMFPFFHWNDSRLLWPNVYNMSRGIGAHLNESLLPLPHIGNKTIKEFNSNFWSSWTKYSSGRGLITTMKSDDIVLYEKQMRILKEFDNKLPLQVITTGSEMRDEFVKQLQIIAEIHNQEIYLVDLSDIIDRRFVNDKIDRFKHKFLSVLFNTFEEAIFMDVDAVPFVETTEFFEIQAYKDTGMYLYRDRSLDEGGEGNCRPLMRQLEPSFAESRLLNNRLKFDLLWAIEHNGMSTKYMTSEEAVFKNMYVYGRRHHIESGLMVINRRKQMAGLIGAMLFGLSNSGSKCSWGDKEFFWLGNLYAGKDYAVNPMEGGIVGYLKEDPGNNFKKTICGTQLAHVDEFDRLMWTNGGLRTCKFRNDAGKDFSENKDHFTSHYKDVKEYQKIQDSHIDMQGVIIPDMKRDSWSRKPECRGYTHCASAVDNRDHPDESYGTLIAFDWDKVFSYNEIAKIWAEDIEIKDPAVRAEEERKKKEEEEKKKEEEKRKKEEEEKKKKEEEERKRKQEEEKKKKEEEERKKKEEEEKRKKKEQEELNRQREEKERKQAEEEKERKQAEEEKERKQAEEDRKKLEGGTLSGEDAQKKDEQTEKPKSGDGNNQS